MIFSFGSMIFSCVRGINLCHSRFFRCTGRQKRAGLRFCHPFLYDFPVFLHDKRRILTRRRVMTRHQRNHPAFLPRMTRRISARSDDAKRSWIHNNLLKRDFIHKPPKYSPAEYPVEKGGQEQVYNRRPPPVFYCPAFHNNAGRMLALRRAYRTAAAAACRCRRGS